MRPLLPPTRLASPVVNIMLWCGPPVRVHGPNRQRRVTTPRGFQQRPPSVLNVPRAWTSKLGRAATVTLSHREDFRCLRGPLRSPARPGLPRPWQPLTSSRHRGPPFSRKSRTWCPPRGDMLHVASTFPWPESPFPFSAGEHPTVPVSVACGRASRWLPSWGDWGGRCSKRP